MQTRRIFVPVALALVFGAGCQKSTQAAPSAGAALPQTPAPFPQAPVLAGTPDIATLSARVKPGVVNITSVREGRAKRMSGQFRIPFGGGESFPFPFGDEGEAGPMARQSALGTGFLVDDAGHVVTNAHVVEDADKVRVKLSDDREFDAIVKGKDPKLDLAVLEIEGAKNLPGLSLGSSEDLRVGEYVVAIGNPFGLGNTVTMGIVSAKGRVIGAGMYDDFIQTDASINPGNSGGPLFNLRGQVVGINTAINPQGRGIGFAIPVDELKDVLPALIRGGKVSRGRIGVGIQPVDGALAKALGLDKPKGALVNQVEVGSPADKAGVKEGDVIVQVDGKDVPNAQELPRIVARHAPGTKGKVTVVRDKGTKTFDLAFDAIQDDGDKRATSAMPESTPSTDFGLSIQDAPGGGAIIRRVSPSSPAAESLAPGDVVVEANKTPIARAGDLVRALGSVPKGQPALLKVERNGRSRWVAIER
ncbi:MAG: trypsin-like peptidase domain-containing protein [Polyangiaceae bacterium]